MLGGLVVMCGLAFSGKSSVARRVTQGLDAHLVSLDDINDERGLWGGQGIPVEEWQRTHHIAEKRIRTDLVAGRIVVLDDTSNLRFLRDGYRTLAAKCGAPMALVFVDTPLPEIAQRRARSSATGDRRAVDDAVFAEHAASFEEPGSDEGPVVCTPDTSIDLLLADLRDRMGR